jgi:hypothetical protein
VIEPPFELSSGRSLLDSWMMATFPIGEQFSPGLPGLPPTPTPQLRCGGKRKMAQEEEISQQESTKKK